MWKPLRANDKIAPGDQLRYTELYSKKISEDKLYEVIKVEQHYFEIILVEDNNISLAAEPEKKIVKYTDIGYHIGMEVRLDLDKVTRTKYQS
jgi:hypothetical protein